MSIWQRFRRWIAEHIVELLFGYFILSAVYQAVTPYWWEGPFGEEQIPIRNGYKLGVRYPHIIPVEPPGRPGRPLTVWVWGLSSTITTTSTISPTALPTSALQIAIHTDVEGVITTDERGREVAPTLIVQPGPDEERAQRSTLYIVATEALTSPIVISLKVWQNGQEISPENRESLEFKIESESKAFSAIRRFFNLFLGTTAAALTAGLVGVIKLVYEEHEKRRGRIENLRESILALEQYLDGNNEGSAGPRFTEQVFFLWDEVQSCPELKASLLDTLMIITARHSPSIWLPYVRRRIQGWCKESRTSEIERRKGLIVAVGIREQSLDALLSIVKAQEGDETKAHLYLEALPAIGPEPEGVEWLLSRLPKERRNDILEEWWKQGPRGRFLVSELQKKGEVTRDFPTELPTAFPTPESPAYPWPTLERPSDPKPVADALQRLELKYNPFGPEFAEQDPWLATPPEGIPPFFFDKHPCWAKAIGDAKALVILGERGSGRTALMYRAWLEMGKITRLDRNQRWLSIPIHLLESPVEEKPDTLILLKSVRRSAARALASVLTADPFALLRSSEETRKLVHGLFVAEGGEGRTLVHWLESFKPRRHPVSNKREKTLDDFSFLVETLFMSPPVSWPLDNPSLFWDQWARIRLHGWNGFVFWYEVPKDVEENGTKRENRALPIKMARLLLEQAQRLPTIRARVISMSPFEKKVEGEIETAKLDWSREYLESLLQYRWSVALAREPSRESPLWAVWEWLKGTGSERAETVQKWCKALLKKATSPYALVRLGNEQLSNLAKRLEHVRLE